MATQKTSVLSFAALTALVLTSTIACSPSKSGNKVEAGPTPEVSKTVTLEHSEIGRKGAEVFSRKYTVTQGEVSVSDNLLNTVFRGGTAVLEIGSEKVTITDYCETRACAQVAAIVSSTKEGSTKADAYLFKSENGKYVEACKQEDVHYSTALEAFDALTLACPAPSQDSPAQETPEQESQI